MERLRSIVLIGHENSGSFHLFQTIVDAFPEVRFTVIVTEGIYYKKSFAASVFKLIRESSILFCAVRALDMLGYRLRGKSMTRECKKRGIGCFASRDINSPETLDQIRSVSPDLLVSLYTMHIYKGEILSIATHGAITSHPSILPHYRGLEVFFWAMANGEATTGVSVFTVEKKVDAGRVICDEVLPLDPRQTMADVYRMITESAGRLLVTAIRALDQQTASYRIPVGEGSYFPMPTRAAVRQFLKRGKRFF